MPSSDRETCRVDTRALGAGFSGASAAVALALALALLAAVGCGGTERPSPEPWPESGGPPAAGTGTASARAAPLEAWDLAGALGRAKVVVPRGPSQHLGAGSEGEILADAAASGYLTLGPGATLPVGATVIERHEAAGVIFAMIKRAPGFDRDGGDWEYLVTTTAGALEDRGRLALCARCHAEAVHDHLFGGGRAR